MLQPKYTKQFEKDLKRIQKRGKTVKKLKTIVEKLLNEEKLEPRLKDHKLTGNYAGRHECHIKPDWLLIYKLDEFSIVFERTGSHSDLFK
jgi:mRNA interferase YafQ